MRRQAEQNAASGSIRGRVVAADSGRALPKTRVSLSSNFGFVADPVYTTATGEFTFDHLPAGQYTLAAEKTGFVHTRFGSRNELDPPSVIAVDAGASVREMTVRLAKGGAVFGRVLDENGDPVVGGDVSLGAVQVVGTELRFVPVNRPVSQTNDLGEYRIGDLPAGRYFVTVAGAGLGSLPDGVPREWEHLTAWGRTYYPGVSSLGEATPVAIGPGEERGAVDFAVNSFQRPHLAVTVTGLVPVDRYQLAAQLGNQARTLPDGTFVLPAARGGSRLPNVTVSFVSIDRGGNGGGIGPTFQGISSTGTSLALPAPGLDPGEWVVVARQGPNSALAHVRLASGDDASLTLELRPGSRLSGRVIFDGRRAAPPMADVRLDVQGAGPDVGLAARTYGSRPTTPRADGTFEIPELFGTIELGATPPAGWTLESVVADGREILGDSLTLESGKDVSGVQVILSDAVAGLSGTILGRDGAPAPGCEVALFPDEPAFRYNVRRMRRVRADQNGRFRLFDVPSGRFNVAAAPDIDGSLWLTPDVLDQLRSRAQTVALAPREQKVVNLSCVSAP